MAAATDLKPRAQWTVIDIRPCGPKCENSTGIESGPSARIRFAKKPASFSSIKWQISEPEYPGSTVRWTVDTPSMPATAFLCVAASPLPREQAKIPNVRNWAVRDYGNRIGIWRLMEVLSRYGIRASAALNSEVCDLLSRVNGTAALERPFRYRSRVSRWENRTLAVEIRGTPII